jgi:hypothetical protein
VLGKLPADQNDGRKRSNRQCLDRLDNHTPNLYTELIFWQRLNQNLPERKITISDNRPRTKTEATKQSQSKPRQCLDRLDNQPKRKLETMQTLTDPKYRPRKEELKFARHADYVERSICGA